MTNNDLQLIAEAYDLVNSPVNLQLESLLLEFANNGVYIFDADNIGLEGKKDVKLSNALKKQILASGKKIDLLVAPAGAGKSTIAQNMAQQFISNEEDVEKAESFLMLAGAARSKDGGITKPLQQQIDVAKQTGGNLYYLYVPNLEIRNRKTNRVNMGSNDLRDKKSLRGTFYAPLNQYNFISQLKELGFKIIKGN